MVLSGADKDYDLIRNLKYRRIREFRWDYVRQLKYKKVKTLTP